MDKVLIITSHPSKHGFTHKIAETYKKASEKKGNNVEIINLYEKSNRLDFLAFEDVKKVSTNNKVRAFQKKISLADEIVLMSPIWWGDVNAMMKNFFDNVFSAGFAFKYIKGKPKGLLNGKIAKIILTCDGPGIFYRFPFISLKMLWKHARLGFCSIKVKNFIIIDRMRLRNDSNRKEVLKRISKLC